MLFVDVDISIYTMKDLKSFLHISCLLQQFCLNNCVSCVCAVFHFKTFAAVHFYFHAQLVIEHCSI